MRRHDEHRQRGITRRRRQVDFLQLLLQLRRRLRQHPRPAQDPKIKAHHQPKDEQTEAQSKGQSLEARPRQPGQPSLDHRHRNTSGNAN